MEMRVGRNPDWSSPPGFWRLMGEAAAFGSLLGTLFGSTTLLFQGELIGIPLGAGFGFVYGMAFGLGGWLVGWVLFHSGAVPMKGSALGLGVVIAGVLYLVGLWLAGATLDPFLILIPAGVAAVTGILRGRWFDRHIAVKAPR